VNVAMSVVLDLLEAIHGNLPVLFKRGDCYGCGRRLARVRLLVENVVIYLAFILDEMGVTVGGSDPGMPCQLLSRLDALGSINDGDEIMPEIMDTNFLAGSGLIDAPLDVMPHITRRDGQYLFPSALVVAHKDGRSLGSRSDLKVFLHSFHRSIGDVYQGRLIALPGNGGDAFKQIHVPDTQIASLRDTQTTISQHENKCSISQILWIVSHSIHIINCLADAVKIQADKVAGLFQSVVIICGIKESRVNIADSISYVPVEPADSRSVQGLRGRGFVGSLEQKVYIGLLREWRILTDNAHKLFQSGFIRVAGLFPACLIHETQEGLNMVFCGKDWIWHNANYIRR
jgi:hypothetical protein